MGRITALTLSAVIGALTTFLGGTIFFRSGSEIAVALETHQLTMHTYIAFFMATCALAYLTLSWLPRSSTPRPKY